MAFGVYLLHENVFVFRMLWPLLEKVFPAPSGLLPEFLLGVAAVLVVFAILDVAAMLIDSMLVTPVQSVVQTQINNYTHSR
jgi:hypothetical protein